MFREILKKIEQAPREPYKQNTPGLHPDIQTSGCFFMASLWMAEQKAKENGLLHCYLTKTQINRLWEMGKAAGFITSDNNVKSSAGIANLALKELGVTGRFVEVATFSLGIMQWYRSVPDAERRADYYIQKIQQNGPNKTHYINVQKDGALLWDPHNPAINSQGIYYTICYRYDGESNDIII